MKDSIKKYRVHIIWALVVIVAFVGGMYVANARSSSAAGSAAAGAARRGSFAGRTGATGSTGTGAGFAGGAGAAGGGFAVGQVLSKNNQSFMVQLANGNSEVVFYSTSTQIIQPTLVSADQLMVGANVMVGGTSNPDGSVTAQTVQIRSGNSSSTGR